MANNTLTRFGARRDRRHQSPSVPDSAHLVLVASACARATGAPTSLAETAATFGARLREARESSGLSIGQIADQTKISPALLTALERGDLTRWPGGIYRRAFFSSYVRAIGLPADGLLHEFLGHFAHRSASGSLPADEPPESGRMSLAGPSSASATRWGLHLRPAAAVLLVALAASTVFASRLWAAAFVVALWYGRPAVLLAMRTGRRVVTPSPPGRAVASR